MSLEPDGAQGLSGGARYQDAVPPVDQLKSNAQLKKVAAALLELLDKSP
jgi:hypothetical protein